MAITSPFTSLTPDRASRRQTCGTSSIISGRRGATITVVSDLAWPSQKASWRRTEAGSGVRARLDGEALSRLRCQERARKRIVLYRQRLVKALSFAHDQAKIRWLPAGSFDGCGRHLSKRAGVGRRSLYHAHVGLELPAAKPAAAG